MACGAAAGAAVLILAIMLSDSAIAQLDFSLLAGNNTLCVGPDVVGGLSQLQNTTDAASCEASCKSKPPCEWWSWCTGAGCEASTLAAELPAGACVLSHDAEASDGARTVTVTSGPAINWTCGHVAASDGSDAGDLITYVPVQYSDCVATCDKAGSKAVDVESPGAAACRVTLGEADTLYGTKESTSPNCNYNAGPGKDGAAAEAFDCICVRNPAAVAWRPAAECASPAATMPNVCRISRSLEDVSAWAMGYIFSDACLIPGRQWGRFGSSSSAFTQVVDGGNGEGVDNGFMGRQEHKVQVLCTD